MSPATAAGTHSYRISPDARWAFHTYSHFDSPSVIELVQLPSHRVVRSLVDNGKQRAAVAPLITRPGEFFRVAVSDGVSLDGWMIKPANFDSTRGYPLLMYVYGEPAGQTGRSEISSATLATSRRSLIGAPGGKFAGLHTRSSFSSVPMISDLR